MKGIRIAKQPLSDRMRGKIVAFNIPKNLDEEGVENFVVKRQEHYTYSSGIANHPNYRYPFAANRLLETIPPHLKRRILKNNRMRRMDRSIINAFCNQFIWMNRLYKPGKK